jgi:hypothetical protein
MIVKCADLRVRLLIAVSEVSFVEHVCPEPAVRMPPIETPFSDAIGGASTN